MVDDVPPTPIWYIRSTICVGVMAAGQGMSVRSNSISTRLSPVPKAFTPNDIVAELPLLTVAPESISTSGTDGKSPVSSKMEPRERFSVWLPLPSSLPWSTGFRYSWVTDHLPIRSPWSARIRQYCQMSPLYMFDAWMVLLSRSMLVLPTKPAATSSEV